jgi:HNH endonuclease
MPRQHSYTVEQVRDAIASARSLTDALRTLGLRPAGGNHKTLRRLIERHSISIDHFDPIWTRRSTASRDAKPLDQVLVENSSYSRGTLKRRLFREGLKVRRCELCGQGEEWRGQPMALILDHINGVATDNRIENLQIVCPNCAATLETHCGRNNRMQREPRVCLNCASEFIPKYPTHRYCSQDCGARRPRPERRKVNRPSYEQLMSELEATSFVAVGRKYGVSGNAVRKWLRCYRADAAARDLDARHTTAANDEVRTSQSSSAG